MRLERHVWRLQTRINALAQIIHPYEQAALNGSNQFVVERAVIQLQIEWEQFVRSVILDSATGRYRARSGPVRSNLPVKVSSREHASFVLIGQYQRRRTEPDWYLPQEAIQAAGKLALTNENRIAMELGVSPWHLDELRFLRNFIAHRSGRSAQSVRAAGCVSRSERINRAEICFDYQSGGRKRYEGWIAFMKSVASRLVD